MKKILLLLLCVVIIFCAVIVFILLTGCESTTEPDVSNAIESDVSNTAEPDTSNSTEPEASNTGELFKFTEDNYPRVDGSTSLVPLAEAVASVLLGKNRDECAEYAEFSRTTTSFKNLMSGDCDILIVSEPAAEIYDMREEQGFEWDMSTIANDGLIFVVNEDNPVDNLTTEQIRKIYTGEIVNWSEVGGDNMQIEPFQRNPTAGSQALMEKLVMQGEAMMDPGVYEIQSMEGLMEAIKNYEDSASAIGYSVYYYANDMKMAEGLKIISVDGVQPSADTIRGKEYPHISEYYAVIAVDEPEDSPARIMYNWLVSEEGQSLISHEGYVSVMEF